MRLEKLSITRMEIGAGTVEQADDGGVDVPHLVRVRRAKPCLGFRRTHTQPGAALEEIF